jgi:MFS family permease
MAMGLRGNLAVASFCFVAVLLAGAPATVLLGRGAPPSWTPAVVLAAVAAAGYAVCHALRRRASLRYLAAAERTGRFSGSATFAYTLAAWLLIAVAGGVVMGTYFAHQPAAEGSYRDGLADYPVPVLFLFAGLMVLAGAGYSARVFRRRHEVPWLRARGIAVERPRAERLEPKEAAKMWLVGVVIDGLLFLSGLLPTLVAGDTPAEDELVLGVLSVVGGPGIVSFVLLVVMLFAWPTRGAAFDALRRPSSLVAIALVVGGMAIGDTAAGGIIAVAGVLLGSITCMNIQNRGSQPWLGFIYLAGNFVIGYLAAAGGGAALPDGVLGWAIVLVAAGYASYEAYKHWREWPMLERPAWRPVEGG